MTPAVHSPEAGLTSADRFCSMCCVAGDFYKRHHFQKMSGVTSLSATGNKLDFESVSNALQILWDEQFTQPRIASHNSGSPDFVTIPTTFGYHRLWKRKPGHMVLLTCSPGSENYHGKDLHPRPDLLTRSLPCLGRGIIEWHWECPWLLTLPVGLWSELSVDG